MADQTLDFKVTYFDALGRRHAQLVRGAAGAGAAMDWVEQVCRPERVVAAIRLDAAALQAFLMTKGERSC